jgi:DUF1365 family protein
MRSRLYSGQLMHLRVEPKRNLFRYRVYMWMVDLDELDELSRALPSFGHNRRALTTIRSRDHLGDPTLPIKANILNYLAEHDVHLDDGRVMLLTNARVLGYVFNPLSVYYCYDRDERLECVVAEVHNTYGERHCYLLRPDQRGRCEAEKEFYVSPFLTVDGRYRMNFTDPGQRLNVTMDLVQHERPVFRATLTGRSEPLTERNLRRIMITQPLMTARVTALIHLHGVGLRLRGLRRVPRPVHRIQDGVG